MASAEYSVLTPERVSLQYDIAGIGSRGAAAMVDTVIQSVALIVVLVALTAGLAVGDAGLSVGRGAGGAALLIGLFALALLAVANGYYIAFEILWNGQTPGKRIVGIRVIRENGYPMRPIDAVVRNIVRIVDWLPAGYGVGVLTMLMNTRSRRLGDFASGTIVVREGSRGAAMVWVPGAAAPAGLPGVAASVGPTGMAAPIGPTSVAAPVGLSGMAAPVGVRLSNGDATLVRDFLVRRSSMEARARADLAARLSAALIHRYALPTTTDPELFLETLS